MWTNKDQARAREEGWDLVTTFDNGTTHPYYEICRHGTPFKFKSNRTAAIAVIEAGKKGSKFHQGALRLAVQSRVR